MAPSLLILAAVAFAEDDVFVEPPDPLAEPVDSPEKDLEAEFGGAWSAGNTDSRKLSASYAAAYRWRRNQLSSAGEITLGSALIDEDGNGVLSKDERARSRVRTAQRAEGDLRYDRFLTDRNSLYLLGGGFTDPYAGYDSRFNGQLGYSHLLLYEAADDDPVTSLSAEVGVDAAREDYTDGVVPNRGMKYNARGGLGFVRVLTSTLAFGQDVEVFVNVEDPTDTRLISDTAITNELTAAMSVKLSYKMTYDTQPVEGYVPADHQGLVSLVATVL
ncbi:MAG TPA: DUF481 domain-containing protein [Myxococcota bacterium]|nr:DUF481 domain-containing protein [Myxococcota bacterium]